MSRPVAVLIGPPGAGKSSVGRRVAKRLGVAFVDTDTAVESAAGKPVADIFIEDGEAHFRALERQAVAAALTSSGVVSLGGGAVMDVDSQSTLRAYASEGGPVVFLDVSLSAAAPRVGFNASRPLLVGNPRQQWQRLMEARRPLYEALATESIVTDSLSPDAVAELVAAGAHS